MSLITGVAINLGGVDYTVPPLSFRQLQTLSPKLEQLTKIGKSMPTMDQLNVVAEVVHAALSRNYKDLTIDEVLDGLDLSNMRSIIPAILGVSGLVGSGEASAGKV